jgi:hypothetical protein
MVTYLVAKPRTGIRASSGIGTHNPRVQSGEDISCLRPHVTVMGPILYRGCKIINKLTP